MARRPLVEVIGEENLDRALRDLARFDVGEGQKAARTGLRAGAKVIAADAKRRVPWDTGDLEQSIGVQTALDEQGLPVAGVRIRRVRGLADPFYWRFVEYGTGQRWNRNRDSKGKILKKLGHYTGVMPARPFLRPAFEAKRQEAVEAVKIALARNLKSRAKRLNKKAR